MQSTVTGWGTLGKDSVTETECWVCGLGVPGGAQGEKKTALSAARGGQENPGDGGRGGRPRLRRALQASDDFRFLSVRSQGRLLCGE